MIRPALILLALTLPANAQAPSLQRLCIFCATPAGNAPLPDMPRESGGIVYRHEVLHGTHLLRLSTTDLIIDSDEWREQRLVAFAARFADETCAGRFRMISATRQTTTVGQYTFRCR